MYQSNEILLNTTKHDVFFNTKLRYTPFSAAKYIPPHCELNNLFCSTSSYALSSVVCCLPCLWYVLNALLFSKKQQHVLALNVGCPKCLFK